MIKSPSFLILNMVMIHPVGFGSQYDRDHFKEMCKTLRVLNAVRDIGIPLSIGQYQVH